MFLSVLFFITAGRINRGKYIDRGEYVLSAKAKQNDCSMFTWLEYIIFHENFTWLEYMNNVFFNYFTKYYHPKKSTNCLSKFHPS